MSEFCAYTEQEWALRQWLKARDGHVTVEGVVSGPGLTNVYEFLQQQQQQSPSSSGEDSDAVLALPRVEQPAAIAAAAIQGNAVALAAVELMLTSYGAELRQVALRTMPAGGLYIAGGIAPKLKPLLHTLVKSYTAGDSLMGGLISSFPLYLVTNDDLGLLGAMVRAQRCLPSAAAAAAAGSAQL